MPEHAVAKVANAMMTACRNSNPANKPVQDAERPALPYIMKNRHPSHVLHASRAAFVLFSVFLLLPLTGCEQIRSLIDSISDGAECTSDSSCLGKVCIAEFPGGYCSTADCFNAGCSNIFGSECLQLPNAATPLCYENCGEAGECRPGYACFAVESASVCLPATFTDTLSAAGALGSACAVPTDCDSGTCLNNYVGGYCSLLDCTSDAECGSGRCLTSTDDEAGTELVACYAGCTQDSACRFGYECVDPDGGGGACVPEQDAQTTPVRNPSGLDDGSPCAVDINCKGGTCLRAAEGYPEGYCTTLDCGTVGCNAPAGQTAQCRTITQKTACYVDCNSDGECRSGYECIGADGGRGYCAPPVAAPNNPTVSGDINVQCDSGGSSSRTITFDIAATTTSFAVVPFSESGSTVRPTRLRLPDGTSGADFNGNHAFLDVNPFYIETAAPVFFPAAPQFSSIVEQGGGTYSLDVTVGSGNLCWYVLQKSAPATRIAVNVYFVGTSGLNASNAGQHAGFSTMIDVFERIYSNAGLQMDTLRLFDVSSSVAERYGVIRNLNDIFEVIKSANDPGTTLEENLSIDVFLINGFAVPEAPGLLGLSLGIPGVPGLHGSAGTALVFTAEYLGSNATQVGQTMAHEIGHFNGLRHTSEHGGTEWDAMQDTPECSNPDRGQLCPDAPNLMFPFSLGTNQESVSAAQAATLRASPHTR